MATECMSTEDEFEKKTSCCCCIFDRANSTLALNSVCVNSSAVTNCYSQGIAGIERVDFFLLNIFICTTEKLSFLCL